MCWRRQVSLETSHGNKVLMSLKIMHVRTVGVFAASHKAPNKENCRNALLEDTGKR